MQDLGRLKKAAEALMGKKQAKNRQKPARRRAPRDAGFSIAELVTVAAVVGVLSTVGIANHRSQQMKAETAEAKHSLTSLYSLQQEFKNTWGVYHGNLVLIGSVPLGIKMYDVGFTDGQKGDNKTLPALEGLPANHYAQVEECSTYAEICDNGVDGCGQKASAKGLTNNYFSCTVDNGGDLLHDDKHSGGDSKTYGASTSAFKAAAFGELDSVDEWSINEKQELVRVQNGEN